MDFDPGFFDRVRLGLWNIPARWESDRRTEDELVAIFRHGASHTLSGSETSPDHVAMSMNISGTRPRSTPASSSHSWDVRSIIPSTTQPPSVRNKQDTTDGAILMPSVRRLHSSYSDMLPYTARGNSANPWHPSKASLKFPAAPLKHWSEAALPDTSSFTSASNSQGLQEIGSAPRCQVHPSTWRVRPSFGPNTTVDDEICLIRQENELGIHSSRHCQFGVAEDGGSYHLGDDIRSLPIPSPQPLDGGVATTPQTTRYDDGGSHIKDIEPNSFHVPGSPPPLGIGEDSDQTPNSELERVLNDINLRQTGPQQAEHVPEDPQEIRPATIPTPTSTVAEDAASTRQDIPHEQRSTNRRTGAVNAFVGVTQRNSGQLLMDDALERGVILSQLGIESEPPGWLDFNAFGSRTKALITVMVLGIVLLGAAIKLHQTIQSSSSSH